MALYNSGFNNPYQPMVVNPQYPQMQQQLNQQQVTMPNMTQSSILNNHNNGIIWVQGEAGAKAYPVNAGNSVLLMDSENECFYIKSTDASGMPMPLRVFQYSEVVQTQPSRQNAIEHHRETQSEIDESKYVTRAEFEELKKSIENLKPNTRTKKEVNKDGE